jgi:hypothetical protein
MVNDQLAINIENTSMIANFATPGVVHLYTDSGRLDGQGINK